MYQSEEARSNLGVRRVARVGGGGCGSDPGIIVGDSGPYQSVGRGICQSEWDGGPGSLEDFKNR